MTTAKEVPPPRSLHRKLAQIMYEAERIPKNGRAPREMGGYEFVQVGDAADYIRKALAEKLITMMPTNVTVVGQQDRPTKSGGSMTTVDLITEWTLTDGESGESITVMSFGAGADGGDKYSGKASTSAMKYALLTTFLLSTGEDSELGTSEAGKPVSKEETERRLGSITREGAIAKGGGQHTDLQPREGPDGHAFGFRLEVGDGKAVPQVIAKGPLGEALFLATGQKPETLHGQKATVEGDLFEVSQAGRRGYHRLYLTRIVTDDFELPAPDDVAEPPVDTVSLPAFSEAEIAGVK